MSLANRPSQLNKDSDDVVIVAAKRTALGSLNGAFATVPAPNLGAEVVRALVGETKVDVSNVQANMFGCVLPAGLGQAPARQVALGGGLDYSAHATTINKVCGSGMQTVVFAYDALAMGTYDCVIAGGMENMSRAPWLMDKPVQGCRPGHQTLKDSLFLDGLEDAYEKQLMGVYAENTARHYEFSREMQDDFAIESLTRAQKAQAEGKFESEIVPVEVKSRKETLCVDQDQVPQQARPDKIPSLRPAFDKEGTVTAANASSIADGAAAVMLTTRQKAKALGLSPLAKVVGHASFSHEPKWFTTAPVGAISALLAKIGWTVEEVDLFEINEAFAVVTMAAIKDLKLDHNKVNIHGGACALGHPLGATGTRILVTLIHALKTQHKSKGIASLCIGGGEALAVAVEIES